MAMSLSTEITSLFNIRHPIILAGMNVAAGPDLAAAVTNAGGLGVIGGLGHTPKSLKQVIWIMKQQLTDESAPFGVNLALPQVGGGARATNYDYTHGQLHELLEVIIEERAALFVSAAGVPPKDLIDKLHKASILVMNMIGHPKHIPRALKQGVDIVCAQGGEGGGHTGDIPFSILIPAGQVSINGEASLSCRCGGIYDGRGLAASLAFGAEAVWVGTRFVASVEAGVTKRHKDAVVTANHGDTITTTIYTGRPLRVRRTPYVEDWETNRQEEIKRLTSAGKIPHAVPLDEGPRTIASTYPLLMGAVAAVIDDVLPAKVIIEQMVQDAVERLEASSLMVNLFSKL
ncbi:hypothetical protein BS47DRAFT_1383259 [Hydnum rufescens UP504]|uniref:2-nitropropane dioxygenase n=1 Tax=Hydnum rufescens UP504 TaxID=1448309 RepID=A0A9P6DS63_9AGAM|nr:hypothetical protein BS47DRAFT_1383259 [Hydnum rufescens UP504]